jgi:hypothetical protein
VSDDNEKTPDMPEAKVDPDVERAPGGVDATSLESEPGAGVADGEPVTPDQPLSAQTDEATVPDEIQEPEGPDETIGDDTESDIAEPEVRPTD